MVFSPQKMGSWRRHQSSTASSRHAAARAITNSSGPVHYTLHCTSWLFDVVSQQPLELGQKYPRSQPTQSPLCLSHKSLTERKRDFEANRRTHIHGEQPLGHVAPDTCAEPRARQSMDGRLPCCRLTCRARPVDTGCFRGRNPKLTRRRAKLPRVLTGASVGRRRTFRRKQ